MPRASDPVPETQLSARPETSAASLGAPRVSVAVAVPPGSQCSEGMCAEADWTQPRGLAGSLGTSPVALDTKGCPGERYQPGWGQIR